MKTLSLAVNKRSLTQAALKDKVVCYAFIAPYMIIFITFTLLPVLASMFLSLTSFNMLERPIFVGAENYIRMFLRRNFYQGNRQYVYLCCCYRTH